MKVEDILRDLVRINTIEDKEKDKFIEYAEKYLMRLKFNKEIKDKCLVMSYGNDIKLSFIGHMDTVNINNKWDYNPFDLTIVDNKLIGRGTCDMKGGISAFLYTLSKIDLEDLKYGIRVCLTYDEEIGFSGIKELVDKKVNFGEYSLIGEPTDNIPCIGSKGLLEYEFIFKGISTHSSMPIEGKSSNENAVIFLNELLKIKNIFNKKKCNLFDVPINTINYGIINGGNSICTVPDNTKVQVGFRITKDKEDIIFIKDYIDKLISTLNFDMEYQILNEINPFINENEIIKFYEEISGNTKKPFFGVSEGSFIDNNKVILGPGPITAHKENEYITTDSLNKTCDIYKKIILKICK